MKEKLEHIWYYYKWYIIAALAVLLLALNFIAQRSAQKGIEHEIALVTGAELSDTLTDGLARSFSPDGSVRVNFYRYDARAMQAEDTALFSAAAVQLANDLENRISCCYITDEPELLREARPALFPAGSTADFATLKDFEELKNFMVLIYNKEDIAWIN